MKKVTILYISLFLTLSFSCKEVKKEATEATQMKLVMDIHDEVMPKMGTMNKLGKQLETKIGENTVPNNYMKAKKDLEDANTAMMDWMMGFGNRFDSDEIMNGKTLSPEKEKWLDEEEIKVKALRDQINSSIENAEALLK